MADLLACPFCGGEPKVLSMGLPRSRGVFCTGCGAKVECTTLHLKDSEWNRRMSKNKQKGVIMSKKTLHNSDASGAKANVSDLKTFGDGDMFRCLCKASSESEGWMKSTKALEISGVGCVVQVTTQQGDNVAEALTFVPGAWIVEDALHGGRMLKKAVYGE